MKINDITKYVAILLIGFAVSACSDNRDDEWDPYISAATITKSTIGYDETVNTISTSGNPDKPWTARISTDDNQDWCSFAPDGSQLNISGKPGDAIQLYVAKNFSQESRKAFVTVTFSDAAKTVVELSFTQYGSTEKSEYERDWAEQPVQAEGYSSYIHKTYYTTLSNGDRVRNYSVCFDTEHKVSRWVAYPLHDIYMARGTYQAEQSNGRTNAWAFDDAVTEYSTDYNGVNSGKYAFISVYSSSIDSYDTATEPIIRQAWQQNVVKGAYNDRDENKKYNLNRGHMLPSASRYNTWDTNAQTFYATNMMPQEGSFNSGAWGKLEGYTRSSVCADTLYVVVGTLFEEGAVRITARERDITIPSHCFKLLLRTKSGKTGRRIDEITDPSELICIGFLFENNAKSQNTPMSSAAVSVAELEERSGFRFFRNINPDIADQVKQQCNLNDWSAIN